MIPVVYAARYRIDIGPHVFPTEKYQLLHQRIVAQDRGADWAVVEPEPASWEQLALVHTIEYLDRMRLGTVTPEDEAQLELPWSAEMIEGFRLMVGGTVLAARLATGLRADRIPDSGAGIAVHIGGGLHHAFPNHGEGFCPFNDVAVAVRVLQAEGLDRHAIVDLDVHQGNGTAFIFNDAGAPPPAPPRSGRGPRVYPEQDVADAAPPAPTRSAGDPRVFTFSMHQQHNYPMWKPRSSLDVGLPDGVHDATYLRELEAALPRVLEHRPGCVFYLAGADPYEDDQLGGLRLTKAGLRTRDRLVMQSIRGAGIPLVVTLAGGYARRVEETVAIHAATLEEAALAALSPPAAPPA